MEAQVENTTQAKPQSIVEQLLEIAKTHDAMDVIGGSTSWRWQEGLITRMPKTKTVAAILTKAFKSDDPRVWIKNTDNELRSYLMSIYSLAEMSNIFAEEFNDKYELLFYYSLADNRGATFDELVFKLALFKYAEVFHKDLVYFEDLEEEMVLSINGEWAKSKVNNLMKKFNPTMNDHGYFSLGYGYSLTVNEECTRYLRELEVLRLRIVGYNSHFDMWRYFAVALTDREMVCLERKMRDFFDEVRNNVDNHVLPVDIEEEKTRKTRFFSLSSFTIPNGPGEELTCKY